MIRILATFFVLFAAAVQAETVKIAVTTSFHNSGLSDILLPAILEDTGLEVQLLVVGTGQAIRLGQAGDVDAILVHSRQAEESFVAEGYGTHRREIMYNDFVLIGPSSDPSHIGGAATAAAAFAQIAVDQSTFVSRGDQSGTHKKELNLWGAANLDPASFGAWYRSVGSGMGASLNIASGMNAYILSDRASWLNFGNKGGLALLFSGDPQLVNQYAFIPVNPQRHNHVNSAATVILVNWLTSPTAKRLIDGYEINGEPLFVFNAEPTQ